MLYQHEKTLGKFMTDGFLLNCSKKLSDDNSPVQLTSTRREDGSNVHIMIKYVNQIRPSDYAYVQFFNIVLRNAMEKLQLELIRRDYYDPKAAVDFKNYRLELWPGYVTSIRQHEEKVMLCCLSSWPRPDGRGQEERQQLFQGDSREVSPWSHRDDSL